MIDMQFANNTKRDLTELDAEQHHTLRSYSEPLLPYLQQEDVTDVVVNDDGKLWVRASGKWRNNGQISSKKVRLILKSVATIRGKELNHDHPILETSFPLDGSRIEGILPPVVPNGILSIRIRPRIIYGIREHYVPSGTLSYKDDPLNSRRHQDVFLEQVPALHYHADIIELAVKLYRNILIVGSTGSGKTTLMNGVIDLMRNFTPEDRLVIIEDTPELQSSVENTVYLLSTAAVSLSDCLVASLRLNPDRIFVGEVRRKKPARVLIESWNTGHSGGIATIHADDALKGLYRLEEIVRTKSARPEIARAVNLVIFIDEESAIPSGRKVREVMVVKGLDSSGNYDCMYV